jgi:hypothetical protein
MQRYDKLKARWVALSTQHGLPSEPVSDLLQIEYEDILLVSHQATVARAYLWLHVQILVLAESGASRPMCCMAMP